jgi:two-component system alkaline phosphatase synthesis response regulator PhoP
MPHILIVEDEEHLAIGIKYNLLAEGFTVTNVADGQSALELLGRTADRVDLVVLDLMLPGMSGYAVCEAMRAAGNHVPVVMLTARTLVEDRIRGFDAGTDVYLQKPFDLDELLSIVRSLLSRRPAAPRLAEDPPAEGGNVFRFGQARVNFDTWEARFKDRPIRLTNLEMKLLRYLVEHEGVVVSREELLKRVWGLTRSPATRTVDTFMFNLRKAFEEDPSRPVHFLSIRGTGYRFVGDATGPGP